MSSKTTLWANAMLDHVTGRTRYAAVTPVVRLYTVKPDIDGTGGTLVTGGSYAQQSVTAGFDVSASGSTSNTAEIAFPTATANWGTVVAMDLYDTTGSDILLIIDVPGGGKTVNNGDDFTIPAAALVLTEV